MSPFNHLQSKLSKTFNAEKWKYYMHMNTGEDLNTQHRLMTVMSFAVKRSTEYLRADRKSGKSVGIAHRHFTSLSTAELPAELPAELSTGQLTQFHRASAAKWLN